MDILVWIADLVADLFNLFETLYEMVSMLFAACNPDDFIQSHTITITGSFDDIGEFYIDLIPGAEYTLSITNLTNGLFYGYVTLEEVAADTSEEEEQIKDYLPDYLVDCCGDPTRRCQ